MSVHCVFASVTFFHLFDILAGRVSEVQYKSSSCLKKFIQMFLYWHWPMVGE